MKIAWFCIPAHGHTNPTLGLVKELTAAGHEVTYFSFEMFREKIEQAGARFIPCDGYDLGSDAKDAGNRVGKDIAFSMELIVRTTLAMDGMLEKVIPEIAPDLIVADSVAFWGKLAALKFGIPFVSSTTTFAFNRYSAKYMQQGIGSLFSMLFALPKINRQLKKLREKGYPVKSFLDIVQNDNETNTVVYTSEEFQPYSETFSDRYCFIGPSVRPVREPMEKPAGKTVYISLGTVVTNRTLYENCIEAVRGTDWHAIVSLGETELECSDIPENVEVHRSVDQMAVLAVADAFVTHCGMNSVSEALWCGVPLVLVPQTPEQGAVAKRTAELGAGELPANRDAASVRTAIEKILSDGTFKKSAESISEGFRKAGGVEKARIFLEKCVK